MQRRQSLGAEEVSPAIAWVCMGMSECECARRPRKQMPNDPIQAMEFAQSKGQARKDGRTGVTFADVAGAGEAVRQLQFVVEVRALSAGVPCPAARRSRLGGCPSGCFGCTNGSPSTGTTRFPCPDAVPPAAELHGGGQGSRCAVLTARSCAPSACAMLAAVCRPAVQGVPATLGWLGVWARPSVVSAPQHPCSISEV